MRQNKTIQDFRKKIDIIDGRIAKLLDKRLSVIKKIAELKKKNKLAVFDREREAEIIKKARQNASSESKEFVSAVFEKIFIKSKQIQRDKKR